MKMKGVDFFCSLPEACISHILSFTSPLDACMSAVVCSIFRSASDSDVVWEKFLPSDWSDIVSRSVSPLEFSSKKELFFLLCRSTLLDEGKTCFWIEEKTGKKCFLLFARHPYFSIIWRRSPRYWRHRTLAESRFPEVSELLFVGWLDIFAKIDIRVLSPKTKYKAYIIINFENYCNGLDWEDAKMSITVGDHTFTHAAYLKPVGVQRRMHWDRRGERVREVRGCKLLPQMRSDGWTEIEMGEFTVGGEGGEGDVTMRLWQANYCPSKSGLIVKGIEIRPSD